MPAAFPFSAIVGQEEMKLALLLNAVNPAIGGATPFVLVVNPKLPAKNAKELQALLKAKPGDYNYASSGNGTIIHLAGAMFLDAADVQADEVWRQQNDRVAGLLGGDYPFLAGDADQARQAFAASAIYDAFF